VFIDLQSAQLHAQAQGQNTRGGHSNIIHRMGSALFDARHVNLLTLGLACNCADCRSINTTYLHRYRKEIPGYQVEYRLQLIAVGVVSDAGLPFTRQPETGFLSAWNI